MVAVSVSMLGAAASGTTAISRPIPAVPVAAIRGGVDFGFMTLAYGVAADGSVKDVHVLSAHSVPVFTRSAINAVQKGRYLRGATNKGVVEFIFVREE